MTFVLVFVCTANRGRSPVAEAVASRLAPPGVDITSRGVDAVTGLPVLPSVLAAAAAREIDVAAHRSAPLGSVRGADLVVGFERRHVATAVVDGGALRDKVFTLPELVRLLGRAGEEHDAVARIAAAAEARAGRNAAADEVLDPVGRSQADVDKIVTEVETLTRRLVPALFG
jgi:protein-tyrosine phosphatase